MAIKQELERRDPDAGALFLLDSMGRVGDFYLFYGKRQDSH